MIDLQSEFNGLMPSIELFDFLIIWVVVGSNDANECPLIKIGFECHLLEAFVYSALYDKPRLAITFSNVMLNFTRHP